MAKKARKNAPRDTRRGKTAPRIAKAPKTQARSVLADLVRKNKSLGNTYAMFPVAEVAKLL